MAEEREITTHEATVCILTSEDMMGLFDDNGNPGEYESANYSALQYTIQGSNGKVMAFQGEEIKRPVYISEDDMGRGSPEYIPSNWCS
jgi:hypothetical protein